ncbi:MAG TPA: SDR family NAD(P)-dependent oxidoreductase [Methylomirabilota bacterium]|nr:SDR family NAD(P)-dependent oxidoreductase [Methylomirabilota bacterium]
MRRLLLGWTVSFPPARLPGNESRGEVGMFDFKDQVVLVTGAGAGIGFGIARAFHAAGARVALGDFRDPALSRAAARLGAPDRVFTQAVEGPPELT